MKLTLMGGLFLGTAPLDVESWFDGVDPLPVEFEQEMVNFLADLLGVTPRPGVLPSGTIPGALLAFHLVDGQVVRKLAGVSSLAIQTFQFDAWASSYAPALRLITVLESAVATLRAAIVAHSGMMGRIRVQGVTITRLPSATFAAVNKSEFATYRRSAEVRFWFVAP